MSNIIDFEEKRKQKEHERRIEEMGGPCNVCGSVMEAWESGTPMHQRATLMYMCPTCFNFRMVFDS